MDPQIIPEGHPSAFVPDENTHLALFGAFLTDSMLEDVVKYTNMKIEIFWATIGPANHRSSTYQLIDLMDLNAIIGMLIFSGSKKDNHTITQEMFSTWSGRPFYRALYSQKRFEFVLRCLRFDDPDTRGERSQGDKFYLIRDLWDATIDNCEKFLGMWTNHDD